MKEEKHAVHNQGVTCSRRQAAGESDPLHAGETAGQVGSRSVSQSDR